MQGDRGLRTFVLSLNVKQICFYIRCNLTYLAGGLINCYSDFRYESKATSVVGREEYYLCSKAFESA